MKVEAFLPHRDPFLFIDEVIEVSNEKIVAKRFVSPNEEFFKVPKDILLVGCYHPSPRNVNTGRINENKMTSLFKKVLRLVN